MLNIIPLPAFTDNYIWLIKHSNSQDVYVVDPGDANVVIDYLNAHQLTLAGILITHHHIDHTGGILALKSFSEQHSAQAVLPVYGPASENINGVNHPINNERSMILKTLNIKVTIFTIPGHTLGHIAYLMDDNLFCGDTLFSGGCGRLFEGSPEQMHTSLTQLSQLPTETKVFCTHEYTLANLTFASEVEPDNNDLYAYKEQVSQLRLNNQPSLPSSIGMERKINPFLRCEQDTIQRAIRQHFQHPSHDNRSTFALLRQWKDNF
ncbi:hydroxyacylglutathione hydrolase [Shewanella surugensis]|uniref:Hydroxyacylglutathione hydrolase n=1 Tax=Shewanella surugensis TaxID=212020 RepID=A0ABT0LDC3_9GAMM|nr:hydroxyacylglutathione hydrolase [Shewanella surugensis]MCL1125136.1 hydroxyacylglutathione hydrolase [Shewanella surugensis]